MYPLWWDESAKKKKMCWVAWTKLVKSNKSGGLGFREVETFNDVLLSKVAWGLLMNSTSLAARVLFGKYAKHQSILEVPLSSSASHG